MLIFVSISVNSKMMDMCCEAESKLATELMYHEVQLERDILEPLNQLAEVKHTHTPLMMNTSLIELLIIHDNI